MRKRKLKQDSMINTVFAINLMFKHGYFHPIPTLHHQNSKSKILKLTNTFIINFCLTVFLILEMGEIELSILFTNLNSTYVSLDTLKNYVQDFSRIFFNYKFIFI